MVSNKIKEIKDTLQSLEIANMGLHHLVDLGKVDCISVPGQIVIYTNANLY